VVRRTSALPAYQIIHNEVIAAIDSFYTFLAIHNFAAEELEVRRYLTEAGSFWNLQLYSLQTTLFIVAARIFDDAPDAHSVHKPVAATIAHPQFFSKHALGARKTPPGQPKPPWLAWSARSTSSGLSSTSRMTPIRFMISLPWFSN
jgi:hypothetical protein